MEIIKWTSRTISFIVEMIMLVILAYAGFKMCNTVVVKYLLAIALPVAVGVLWGFIAAPKATRRLKQPTRTIFKLALFLTCAALLYNTGKIQDAIIFVSVAFLNEIVAFLLKD